MKIDEYYDLQKGSLEIESTCDLDLINSMKEKKNKKQTKQITTKSSEQRVLESKIKILKLK